MGHGVTIARAVFCFCGVTMIFSRDVMKLGVGMPWLRIVLRSVVRSAYWRMKPLGLELRIRNMSRSHKPTVALLRFFQHGIAWDDRQISFDVPCCSVFASSVNRRTCVYIGLGARGRSAPDARSRVCPFRIRVPLQAFRWGEHIVS